ncbi:MAG TPA: filamentous hemagglutinin N-terminal domain-containing protein, partial [Candidatus Saccharimonadales bacterium]|nr:filamentous hemagglutinin N-terminal domain-containing protein [Candidatus Saccharimonadales bacterium]
MKRKSDRTGWRSLRHWFTGLMAGCTSLPAMGGPHGMSVQQGSASAVRNGSTTDITASHNAVINWSSFNIGSGETVNFHQPNAVSVVWNRIFDANPTQIWGNLNANGWVVLMNQNGFFFGPNSSVNVGGFMATTTPVAPPPSAGGGMWQFNGTPPLASIINYGQVKANNGGSIFMVAEKIENHGVLSAPDGTLALYAGKEVLVSDRPDGRGLSARVNLPSGSVDNDGQLIADAGTIALHAKVVNNNGLAQANSVRERNGHIEFVATDSVNLGAHSDIQARGGEDGASDGGHVKIQSAGTFADQAGSHIDVAGGSQGGNGGSVELSALSMATPKSTLDGHAQAGWRGGSLLFDPYDIVLTSAEDASSDSSGTIQAANSPGSSLRLNVNTAFGGFSDIHLQALHDISLELSTVWDLNQSTGISDAGSRLTLEAGNNIVFGDNARITSAGGWSVRLAAGVDFNSPTLASIPGTGSIYLNGGAPDAGGAKPNGSGAVEVAEGSISMAAGHDILVGGGYIRTTAGGSIHLATGDGDVDAGTKNDTYDFPSRFPYRISARGLGGIGTAAGGDVRIEAGRDILAFNAFIGAFADGNVFLGAGRDIKGRFMLRNGTGNLEAGQDIGSGSSPISLGLVSGGWSATAARDLYLNEIYNPNGSQNSSRIGGVAYRFDYAPDAYARLAAGNSVQLLGNAPIHDISNGNADRPVIYAPQLDIDAGAGGVVLGNDVILFPSPLGSLHIRTTDGGALRSVPGRFYQLVVSDSGSLDYRSFAQGHAVGRPLHLNSGDAGIHLDIAGDVQNLFLRVPRQADITIGGNARNFSFEGQNLSPNDVTSLHVTGNWFSRSDRTFVVGTLNPPSGVILSPNRGILDPLAIFNDPLAAVSPDLGARITYDPVTHRLGFQGIMTSQERDFLLHPQIYQLDPLTRTRRLDSSGNFVVIPVSSPIDAAAVQSLYAESQDIPTSALARNGLQLGGPGRFDISAHNLDLGITAGIRS